MIFIFSSSLTLGSLKRKAFYNSTSSCATRSNTPDKSLAGTQVRKPYIAGVSMVDTITVRWLFLLWLLISAAVTYFSMSNLEHFVVVDHQILNDPNFREADRYWKQKKKSTISYSGSSINIDNTVVSSEVIAQHINISGPVFVRLSVEVGSEAIFPNEKPWSGGSVDVLVQFVRTRKFYT